MYMYWIGKLWQRRKDLLYRELMDGLLSFLLYEQLDTAQVLLVIIFLTDLFNSILVFNCLSITVLCCSYVMALAGSTLARLNYKSGHQYSAGIAKYEFKTHLDFFGHWTI